MPSTPRLLFARLVIQNSAYKFSLTMIQTGDFGLARNLDPSDATDSERVRYRGSGTRGELAPEHFTIQWNYRDCKCPASE